MTSASLLDHVRSKRTDDHKKPLEIDPVENLTLFANDYLEASYHEVEKYGEIHEDNADLHKPAFTPFPLYTQEQHKQATEFFKKNENPYIGFVSQTVEIEFAKDLYEMNPNLTENVLRKNNFVSLWNAELCKKELEQISAKRDQALQAAREAKMTAQEVMEEFSSSVYIKFSGNIEETFQNARERIIVDHMNWRHSMIARNSEEVYQTLTERINDDTELLEGLGIPEFIWDSKISGYDLLEAACNQKFKFASEIHVGSIVKIHPQKGTEYAIGGDTDDLPAGSVGEITNVSSKKIIAKFGSKKLYCVKDELTPVLEKSSYELELGPNSYKALHENDAHAFIKSYRASKLKDHASDIKDINQDYTKLQKIIRRIQQ